MATVIWLKTICKVGAAEIWEMILMKKMFPTKLTNGLPSFILFGQPASNLDKTSCEKKKTSCYTVKNKLYF